MRFNVKLSNGWAYDYTLEQIHAKVSSGELPPKTTFQEPGSAEWLPIAEAMKHQNYHVTFANGISPLGGGFRVDGRTAKRFYDPAFLHRGREGRLSLHGNEFRGGLVGLWIGAVVAAILLGLVTHPIVSIAVFLVLGFILRATLRKTATYEIGPNHLAIIDRAKNRIAFATNDGAFTDCIAVQVVGSIADIEPAIATSFATDKVREGTIRAKVSMVEKVIVGLLVAMILFFLFGGVVASMFGIR